MTKILSLSGKKQSGKNTAYNFLLGMELVRDGIVRGQFTIEEDGQLYISDLFGDQEIAGIFDPNRDTEALTNFFKQHVYPFLKNYSFADLLKQKICIEVLGLTREQVYGTDAQKMSETHLRWENMPGITDRADILASISGKYLYENGAEDAIATLKNIGLQYHAPGPMTGRDVMQYVGTEVFRKMYPTVWADGTIRRIQDESPEMAVITDCRFPDEVAATQNAGGKVIRLTRCPFPDDKHPSETALDPENFDWSKFDAVIDNRNLTIHETNKAIYEQLVAWDWEPQVI